MSAVYLAYFQLHLRLTNAVMEDFNFASERVQELIARLQGVTFFCAVAMAAVNGNPDTNSHTEQSVTATDKVQKTDQADASA